VTCHSWHRQVTTKSRKVASLAQIPALDSRVPSISDAQGCTGERHKQEAQGGAARDMKAAIDQWPARPASQPRLASPRWRLLPSPWRNGNKQNLGDRLGVSGSARSTHFQCLGIGASSWPFGEKKCRPARQLIAGKMLELIPALFLLRTPQTQLHLGCSVTLTARDPWPRCWAPATSPGLPHTHEHGSCREHNKTWYAASCDWPTPPGFPLSCHSIQRCVTPCCLRNQ
jgi:hypothetical protein